MSTLETPTKQMLTDKLKSDRARLAELSRDVTLDSFDVDAVGQIIESIESSCDALEAMVGIDDDAEDLAELQAEMQENSKAIAPRQTNSRPPRDDLFRAVSNGVELRELNENGMPSMTGHFTPFNQWTEIDSVYEGRFMERIAPGAFARTFKNNRASIRTLFQHGRDPQIGNKPLGPIEELEEDEYGARYVVPLLDTSYNRDLLPGLKAGLYGASFRFRSLKESVDDRPTRSDWNPDGIPERTVQEAQVMEFGPVTFPAYAGASAGVRSLTDEFLLERFLSSDRLRQLVDYIPHSDQDSAKSTPSRVAHSNEVLALRDSPAGRHAPSQTRTGNRTPLFGVKEKPSWVL